MEINLLWIAPKWPYPALDGARVATLSLLESVLPEVHTLDFAAWIAHGEAPPEDEKIRLKKMGVRAVLCMEKNRPQRGIGKWSSLALESVKTLIGTQSLPLTISPYSESRSPLPDLSHYTHVVFDGLHGAAAFPQASSHCKRIYRAHNVESDLWVAAANRPGLPSMYCRFLRNQAQQVREFETSLVKSCELIATISADDKTRFGELTGTRAAHLVPVGMKCVKTPLPFQASPCVSFLGKMDWKPNREGLSWFLESVWPKAHQNRPDLKLKIAGSGDDRWLRSRYSNLPGVELLGKVAQLEDVFGPSWISIAPVLFGSGTRIKVLESARFGRACLGTSMGMQGSGLSDPQFSYTLDPASDWIECLSRLKLEDCVAKGQSCLNAVRETLDSKKVGADFVRHLSSASVTVTSS